MYELAYERFIVEVATRIVDDEEIRRRLFSLVDPSDDHGARIAAELERLNASLFDEDRPGVVRAALQDVGEVERAARDFYLRSADQVHDPRVAKLFRELAQTEAKHAAIADEALRLADRKAGWRADAGDAAEALRMLGTDLMPLREGAGDFGQHKLHKRKGA